VAPRPEQMLRRSLARHECCGSATCAEKSDCDCLVAVPCGAKEPDCDACSLGILLPFFLRLRGRAQRGRRRSRWNAFSLSWCGQLSHVPNQSPVLRSHNKARLLPLRSAGRKATGDLPASLSRPGALGRTNGPEAEGLPRIVIGAESWARGRPAVCRIR
jgi:hypothetical protein